MNQRHFCQSLVVALPLLFAASLHAAEVATLPRGNKGAAVFEAGSGAYRFQSLVPEVLGR